MTDRGRGIDTKATEELRTILDQWKDEDTASRTSGKVRLFTPVQSPKRRRRSKSASRNDRTDSAQKSDSKGEVTDPFKNAAALPKPILTEEGDEVILRIYNTPETERNVTLEDFKHLPGRDDFIAILTLAALLGQKYYRAGKAALGTRWQFESPQFLIDLINNPKKMESTVQRLNLTVGASPKLTDFSPLLEFEGVIEEEVLNALIEYGEKDEAKSREAYLLGLRRIMIRNFGPTPEMMAAYESLTTPKTKTTFLAVIFKTRGTFIRTL